VSSPSDAVDESTKLRARRKAEDRGRYKALMRAASSEQRAASTVFSNYRWANRMDDGLLSVMASLLWTMDGGTGISQGAQERAGKERPARARVGKVDSEGSV